MQRLLWDTHTTFGKMRRTCKSLFYMIARELSLRMWGTASQPSIIVPGTVDKAEYHFGRMRLPLQWSDFSVYDIRE
jgi:hypothetical protein